MISISNAFRQLLKSGDTDYQNIVIITLANGTVLGDLTHEHILIGGIDKDNAVSEDTAFTALGAAIINSISVTIDNRDETYSNYDFKGAKVTYRIRKLVNGTVENLLIGTYTVEDTRYNGFSIVLECLDYMEKFDRPYVTGLNYPTSALNVVREACSKCDVLLNETRTGFPSLSDSIDTKPEGDAITYRDVIASIAQMHGYYAFANVNGRLDFGWFNRSYLDTLISRIDNNTFNPANIDLTKVHYIDSLFSQDISVDDVYISGVAITITQEVTVTDEETGSTSQQDVATTYSRGTDDYVISIEDNLFINADNVNVIADRLADLLIGLRFRKCTITHLNDFTMEAGDIAVIKDRKGSYYPILVTRSNFKVGGRQTTVSGAETPSRNVSKIYSKYTKNIVRNNALLNREKTQRELQYEDLVDKLANSNGLYMTADVDEGGASIYYLHNKPNKDESNIIWKMTSEAVAVSSDGGETWNAGLTVDGALLVKILSAIGINADWINAGAITVTDPNGNVIFEVSKDENRVIIRDTAISIGGMKLPDKLDEIMSNISWQSDTKIETWYQDTDPSLTWGQKESNWIDSTSADILDQNGEPIPLLSEMQESDHNGDIWHKTDDNTEWRYQDGEWQPVDVPDYVFDKIDGKAAIWGVQPVPPYNENDLWFTGEDILYCVHSRAENESFDQSDWIKKDYYTDDSALQEWITGDYKDTIDDIKTQVDGKAETWYQANDPSTAWTTPELKNLHKGDLWFKTTDSTTWYWDGTKWNQQDVPLAVFDEIDGKASVFSNQPVPPYYKNDLWFTGTDILVCIKDRESGNFSQNDWQKKDFYTDDSALLDFIENSFAPLSSVVDGKINTYYQETDPSKNWTPAQKSVNGGDLWYNTTTQKTSRWTGSAWEEMKATPPSEVFDAIDGKATIFTGTKVPTNPSAGDLWFKGANEPILTYVNNAWTEYNKYTDDSSLNTFMNGEFKTTVQALQEADDTKTETWYQYNNPADAWTTSDLKNKHKGDIWYNTTASVQKYFIWTGTVWDEMKTVPPASIMDTIDGKAQIFTTTPSTPYEVGDVWFTGSVIRVCVKAKSTGSYTDSDWVKKDEYTDNSALTTFLNDTYAKDINQLQGLIDGKIDTYYRTSDPSTSWTSTEKSKHVGDIWYNSSTNVQKTYRWTGSAWEEMKATPPSEVFDAIDGKAQIFSGTPTPPYYVNDLWFTGNEIRVCIKQRLSGNFLASEWAKKDYYTDYHQMTSYETWQQLTDNGTLQGIVYDQNTGQLYINGEYIRANTLDGDLIKAGSIKADRLAIASGTNMYASYDTMSQIALSTLTDATSPSATAGITTTSRGPGYNLYNADSNIPVYGVKYFRLFTSSSDTNVYIFLGHSSTQEGRIPVRNLQKYRISFYARGNASNVSLALWIREFSGSTQTYQSVAKTYTLTTSWKRYEADYTAEPHTSGGTYHTTTHIRLGFALRTASAYLDVCAIMVEEIENFNYETSAFSPASITVIDGGNIRSKSITSEQISIVGGWTIEANRMYANKISLTANNGRIDFQNYTNPYGNIERTTAYITNNGDGSFYNLYSDTLTVGGELIGDPSANAPSIDASRTYVNFGQAATFNANTYLRGNSTRIYGTGYFSGNVYLLNQATGTGTYTLFVNPQGLISRGSIPESSSIRYKNHVRELTSEDAKALYKLRPIWYKYKPEILPENDSLIDKPLPGFYAEDVAEIIPEATYKNDDGLVENWRPKEIIPYLVKTIQDQHRKIEELENKLDEILTLLKGRDI